MSRLGDAALAYAASGWPVFPCEPGGKPPLGRLAPHGLKDASTDPERIVGWWRAEPEANIGLSCGEAGLLVLDIDGEEGEAAVKALQGRCGTLGETRWQRTGGGGWQALYEASGLPNTCGKLGPGLDTRGDGGYVVLPPSVHPSGERYAWWDESAPIASLPPWLRRLLTEEPRPALRYAALRVDDRYVRAALEREAGNVATTPQGARNSTLNVATFSLARLIGGHLSEGELVTAMLDAAAACGLPAGEARRTIASAVRARTP